MHKIYHLIWQFLFYTVSVSKWKSVTLKFGSRRILYFLLELFVFNLIYMGGDLKLITFLLDKCQVNTHQAAPIFQEMNKSFNCLTSVAVASISVLVGETLISYRFWHIPKYVSAVSGTVNNIFEEKISTGKLWGVVALQHPHSPRSRTS